ncbi:MAG: phage/plasmid primase, P4 family, partial [Lactobacillus sp.]|nr:phage/plasmid primase, P4 family [Lactobacillus sp.]
MSTGEKLKGLNQNHFIKLFQNDEGKVQPAQKLSSPSPLEDVNNEPFVGSLMENPYVVYDVDDHHHYELLLKLVHSEKIKTMVVKTDRGGHFWFKSDKPIQNHVGVRTALTIKTDIRSYGKKSYVKVKAKGQWRPIIYDNGIDYVPKWLTILPHSEIDLVDAKEGDGRNETLFKYIINLTQKGLSRDDISETYRLINTYLFNDPLDSQELDTILREDSFTNLKPAFIDKKGRFLHDVFGEFLIMKNHVYQDRGHVYSYQHGYYSDNDRTLQKAMLDEISDLTIHERNEVSAYIRLQATNMKRANSHIISVQNGEYDFHEQELLPWNPKDFVRNQLDVVYNANAYDKTVDKTLDKIVCHDDSLRALIEEMIGYIILPVTTFQKAFILYGGGSNGKSSLLTMIHSLVGYKNVSALSLAELSEKFKVGKIVNKLVNIGDDINDDYLKDSSVFKKLVTGDEITVENKNQDPFEFNNYATMLFATNNLPQTHDKSEGMNRRLAIIPFNAKFSPQDDDFDPFITDKLTNENAKSYLFNLALEGVQRL